jgi:glycosyltransferase involved in cell wall biosynthesis
VGKDVSVIVPAYNEQHGIVRTLNSLKAVEGIKEIIVVDDGSTDGTYELLKQQQGITLLHLDSNKGKGYAVRHGLKHASCGIVALLDADLCESAAEVSKLLEHMDSGMRKIVIGRLPAVKKPGGFGVVKKVSTQGFYALTSRNIYSLLSGQRVIPLDFLSSINLPDGFGLEFKITLEAVRRGFEITEVPVNMFHRETGRDIRGFLHRGRQCKDIIKLIYSEMRVKN